MESVDRLLYWSRCVREMSTSELLLLLDAARGRNKERGITGMLLHKDGAFLQVLEGSQSELKLLFERIVADPRHTEVKLLHSEQGPRQFSQWSMGFENLQQARSGEHSHGMSDLMDLPFDADYFGSNPSKAQAMLLCFRGLNDTTAVTRL